MATCSLRVVAIRRARRPRRPWAGDGSRARAEQLALDPIPSDETTVPPPVDLYKVIKGHAGRLFRAARGARGSRAHEGVQGPLLGRRAAAGSDA